MKVRMTFDFSEASRRAVAAQTWSDGRPASYADMVVWINKTIDATLQGVESEQRQEKAPQ